MKIDVFVINSDDSLEAILSSENVSDGILWKGFADRYNDNDYCISILTDENEKIKSSKKGNKIRSSITDINKEFWYPLQI